MGFHACSRFQAWNWNTPYCATSGRGSIITHVTTLGGVAASHTLVAPAPRLWLTLHNLSPTDGAAAFLPRGGWWMERTVSVLQARLIGRRQSRSCVIAVDERTANHG